MNKLFGIWVMLLMFGGMVLLLFNLNGGTDDLVSPEMGSMEQIDSVAMVTNWKLKDDHGIHASDAQIRTKGHMVDIEDYDPIDPVPSSKTSVKHGPIQHGSPIIPYIPKPSPPNHPPSP